MMVRYSIQMHKEAWKKAKDLGDKLGMHRDAAIEFILHNSEPEVWEARIKEKETQLENMRMVIEKYRKILADNGIKV